MKKFSSAQASRDTSTSDSRKTVSGALRESSSVKVVTRSRGVTLRSGLTATTRTSHHRLTANKRDASAIKAHKTQQPKMNNSGSDPQNAGSSGNQPPNQIPVAPQPNIEDWRQLLRVLVNNKLELPEFAGRDYEDPNVFIRGCEEAFLANNTENHARVRNASRALRDDAARWWSVYKNLNLSWHKFCELLRSRYASQNVLMRLSAKLYGQQQAEKESTGLFLEERHLLARRLLPNATEEAIVAVLLESLRGSIKKILRGSTYDSVEELIDRATQIERDELEERNAYKRNATAQVVLPNSSRGKSRNQVVRKDQARELPQCHFCPERHWNRDCPRNPHRVGNAYGESNRAAPTAPSTSKTPEQ